MVNPADLKKPHMRRRWEKAGALSGMSKAKQNFFREFELVRRKNPNLAMNLLVRRLSPRAQEAYRHMLEPNEGFHCYRWGGSPCINPELLADGRIRLDHPFEISHMGILSAPVAVGVSVEAAILDLWSQITDLPSDHDLKVNVNPISGRRTGWMTERGWLPYFGGGLGRARISFQ